MNNILIIIMMLTLISCGKDWTEHERFMNESDCFVYNHEVNTESLDDYAVEFIDTTEASGCVKAQLSKTYLLNLTSEYYVSVIPEHPRENLHLIERFLKVYKNDSIRLSSFLMKNDRIYLTLDKLHNNSNDKIIEGKYYEWKYLHLSQKEGVWKVDSSKNTKFLP